MDPNETAQRLLAQGALDLLRLGFALLWSCLSLILVGFNLARCRFSDAVKPYDCLASNLFACSVRVASKCSIMITVLVAS